MMEPDVNVQLINFPNSGREMVVPNEDGSYTILINARLSSESQMQAYAHAMEHIMSDDFEKQDVQIIEAAAHERPTKPITTEPPKAVVIENIVHPTKRRKRRRNRKQERYAQERAAFLMEHCDIFAIAEHNYLYGNDL